MFDRMISDLLVKDPLTVSRQQFDSWLNTTWVFRVLAGKRLGQAFIEDFSGDKIEMNRLRPLYFFKDNTISKIWIMNNHVVN